MEGKGTSSLVQIRDCGNEGEGEGRIHFPSLLNKHQPSQIGEIWKENGAPSPPSPSSSIPPILVSKQSVRVLRFLISFPFLENPYQMVHNKINYLLWNKFISKSLYRKTWIWDKSTCRNNERSSFWVKLYTSLTRYIYKKKLLLPKLVTLLFKTCSYIVVLVSNTHPKPQMNKKIWVSSLRQISVLETSYESNTFEQLTWTCFR